MKNRHFLRDFGRRRRGFSLVEMLVVVALSSLVLGTVIALIVELLNWDRRFRGRDVENDRLIELAEVLRADIRRATDVRADAEGQLIVVSPVGRQTRYELEPRGCSRIVETTDAADGQRELFAIGPALQWNVTRNMSGRRPLVMVTLDRTDPESRAPRRVPLLVYGTLGADLVATPASE